MDYFSQLGVSTVIVDDGSHDAHGVATVAAQATLIRHDYARGPAAARNAGIRASLTPWVFLVDSDVDLKNFDLERFASWCQRDDAALIAPRVIGSEGRSLRERFDRRNGTLDLGPEPGRIGARKAINFVPSAAMLLRTGILDAPFDETLLVGEDVDLVWRLEEAGWNLLYRPEYLVTHRTRATWSAWLTQRYCYARAAADLSERHGEQAAPVRGSALTIGAWVLLFSGYTTPAISLFSLSKRRLDASLIRFDNDALSAIIFAKAALRPGPRLARQLLRTYGPALLGACLFSKRIRRLTFTAVLLGGIDRWWRSERDLDPLRFIAVSTLEDLAYATGLSAGAMRRRSPKALLPHLTWRSRS
jgi:mycofactocin system glycosyltransferase